MHESYKQRPMDKSQIVASLDDFMSSNVRKTVTLKGPWGCGKTHFWKEYVCKTKAIREKKISYISLFDVSSIKEVKSKIIVSSLVKDTNGWRTHIKSILAAIREQFGKLPYLGKFLTSEATLGAIEDLYLKDFLICMDDLERRSSNLEISQVLGFISVLRENRNCRVVLILNEEQLEPADKEVLNQYRDKIIDMELCYSPTVRENAGIAFPNHEIKNELLLLFEQAGTNNIRIMQRTIWRVDRLLSIIPETYTEARKEISMQLAILCCLHYSEKTRVDINKINELHPWLNLLVEKDPHDENTLLAEKLKVLGWGYPEYADLLTDAVLNENFHVERIQDAAEKIQKRYQDSELNEKVSQAYEKFNSNFQGSIENVQQSLEELLDNYSKTMSWNQLGQTVSLLQELGCQPDVANYQKEYLDAHPEDIKNERFLEHVLLQIQDPELKKEIEKRLQGYKSSNDLGDCMEQVSYEHSWGGDISDALKNATREEYVNLFKTSNRTHLLSLVRNFLAKATSFGEKDKEWANVAERIRLALAKMAEESELNRLRIKKFFENEINLTNLDESGELPRNEQVNE